MRGVSCVDAFQTAGPRVARFVCVEFTTGLSEKEATLGPAAYVLDWRRSDETPLQDV